MDRDLIRERLEGAVLTAMDAACSREMAWGHDDCALWCADAIAPVVGYDAAAQWRTGYKDRAGAHAALGNLGLGYALKRTASKHSWERIAPKDAQPGDVGLAMMLYQGKPSAVTVMCRARGWFVGRNEMGFTALQAAQVRVCWSVLGAPESMAAAA